MIRAEKVSDEISERTIKGKKWRSKEVRSSWQLEPNRLEGKGEVEEVVNIARLGR